MKPRFVQHTPLIALLGTLWLLTINAVVLAAAPVVPPVTPAPTSMNKDKPFKAVAGAPAQVSPGQTVQLRYTIYPLDKEHYVYKERTSLKVTPVPGISYGPVQFSPEAEKKHDAFEDRDMEIYHVPVTLYVEARVAPDAALGPRTIEAVVNYQGCNPTVCFFPTKEPLSLKLEVVKKNADSVIAPASSGGDGKSPRGGSFGEAPRTNSTVSGGSDTFTNAMQHGLLWAFLAVFGLGVLASFTPCIYPIIPITISVLGARNARSKLQGFSIALVYVLGLALTYTAFGVFAATTGALWGGVMQNKWVVGGIAALFIAMGFSMLGVFNVALPSGMTTRLSQVQGRGYPGAFLMGAVAGVVASPCVGPLIVSLLAYIANTGDVTLGAALMFTFALGMGQLFIVLGTFAVSMPKSGAWMDTVKGALALTIFGVGLYYLQTVVPAGYYELLIGISALIAGTYVGAFHSLREDSGNGARLRKVAGVLMVTVGLYSVVGGLLTTRLVAPQLTDLFRIPAAGQLQETQVAGIQWETDYTAAMAKARDTGAPVLIDFTADWCAACKELEHKTYTDARVISAASEFVRIKVDGTEQTPAFEALQAKYNVKGMPTVLFLSPDGQPNEALTITGFLPAEEFLQRMCQVQGLQAKSGFTNVCRG